MTVKKLSISLSPEIVQEIETRGDQLSTALASILERHFYALTLARRDLRQLLTETEISLILDTLNGTIFEPFSVQYVDHEIVDAISLNHLDKKWSVDGPGLVDKLQEMDYIHKLALVDAAERWWQKVGAGDQLPFVDALK